MKNVPSSANCPNFSQLQRMFMRAASFPFRRSDRLVYLKVVEERFSISCTNCADTQLVELAESQSAITGRTTGMLNSAARWISTMNANICWNQSDFCHGSDMRYLIYSLSLAAALSFRYRVLVLALRAWAHRGEAFTRRSAAACLC